MSALLSVLMVLLLVPLGFLAARAVWMYLTFRGVRIITCPETHRPAAVAVDTRAALSRVFDRRRLRLKACSRWPERVGCGQDCVFQIDLDPHASVVETIVAKWYADKVCVLCRKPIAREWALHKPALRAPDGRTIAWAEFRPEMLPEAFETHQPVCWDCHIAGTFRRRFPDLSIDRPERPDGRPRKST